MSSKIRLSVAGGAAGLINGLFGAGGGMILVPLLRNKTEIHESECFSASVAIITPICIISLLCSLPWQITFKETLPYLLGSTIGGICAGLWGQKIPTVWLHRILGALVLWGGIRYLW